MNIHNILANFVINLKILLENNTWSHFENCMNKCSYDPIRVRRSLFKSSLNYRWMNVEVYKHYPPKSCRQNPLYFSLLIPTICYANHFCDIASSIQILLFLNNSIQILLIHRQWIRWTSQKKKKISTIMRKWIHAVVLYVWDT